MKVQEFKMLVHVPFATNVYLDLVNLQERLKKLSLSRLEIEILKYTVKKKTEDEIIQNFSNYNPSDIIEAIRNLKSYNFLDVQNSNFLVLTVKYIYNQKIKGGNHEQIPMLFRTQEGLDHLRMIDKFPKSKKNVFY